MGWVTYLTGIYKGTWKTPGWCLDIYTFYHRGRYGWAPSDTWNLNTYLNGVLSGSLEHLADNHMGCPSAYYIDGNCDKWEAQLRDWVNAFEYPPESVDIYDAETNYRKQTAEENRRRENIRRTLMQIAERWESLWD
jgi:hypothetical protein